MRKLTAVFGTAALAAGLLLAGSGAAFADNNTYGGCSQPHSVNIANCATVLDLGPGPILSGPIL
jgi:hypothetical protein